MASHRAASELTQSQIQAMVKQEEMFYQCSDYLSCDHPDEQLQRCPLNLVAELSFLVTDTSSHPDEEESREKRVQSPQRVGQFPSPTSSLNDLTADSLLQPMNTSRGAIPKATQGMRRRSWVELSFMRTWRHQMLEWAYMVTHIYAMERGLVAVAFALLDRYLAIELDTTGRDEPLAREEFQLYSMVALYIAVKGLVPVRKLTVETLQEMARGLYQRDEIVAAESRMLRQLGWHINPPTTMDYCRLYLQVIDFSSTEDDATQSIKPDDRHLQLIATCQYLSELTLDDDWFISKSSHLSALAIFLVATRGQNPSYDIHGFLQRLRDTACVEGEEFHLIAQRLECLC